MLLGKRMGVNPLMGLKTSFDIVLLSSSCTFFFDFHTRKRVEKRGSHRGEYGPSDYLPAPDDSSVGFLVVVGGCLSRSVTPLISFLREALLS